MVTPLSQDCGHLCGADGVHVLCVFRHVCRVPSFLSLSLKFAERSRPAAEALGTDYVQQEGTPSQPLGVKD